MRYKLYLPMHLRIEVENIIMANQDKEDIHELVGFALSEVLPLIGVKDISNLKIVDVQYIQNTGEIRIELEKIGAENE